MIDQSSNLHQMMLEDLPECISFRELQDGTMPLISQDGENEAYGLEAAPASRSAQPVSAKATTTNGTSGPKCFGSLESASLSLSLANRLKERCGSDGSMEYSQTWKEKITPAGRLYWAHTASGHRTSGSGCTGWPTTGAQDEKWRYSSAQSALRRLQSGKQVGLEASAYLAGWATPTSKDHKDGPPCANVETNALLGRQVWLSHVPTENRGALNPAFSCWLMGYPPEWCDCAVTAMQSFRSVRKRS